MAIRMPFRHISNKFVLSHCISAATAIALVVGASKAQAQAATQIDPIHAYMRAVNTPTPLETAACHGQTGFTIGVGALQVPPDAQVSESLLNNAYGPSINPHRGLLLPNIWVTKGIFWPLDIGLNFGYVDDLDLQKIGGYVQWSIYQEFLRPALALRIDHSQLSAKDLYKTETSALSGIFSWGYGPISLVASGGLVVAKSALASEGISEFGLLEMDESKLQKETRPERRFSYGVQLQVPGSLLLLAAENILTGPKGRIVAAKISVGM
jgi:hypothetical protein